MIVVDTSFVVALLNRGDAHHAEARNWIATTDDELVTTPLAVAEIDHLVARFGRSDGTAALWRDLDEGAYTVDWWPGAVGETIAVAAGHERPWIGLTDASLVALAARVHTTLIATLDERHFRALAPLTGEPAFTLLPADAS
ncbi:MAG: PIN domain-containing protein [Thermoleophilaceae bacterium]